MKWKNSFGYSRRRWLLHCPLAKRYWFVFQAEVLKGGDVDVASKKWKHAWQQMSLTCCEFKLFFKRFCYIFILFFYTNRAKIVKFSESHLVAVGPVLGCRSCVISSSGQEAGMGNQQQFHLISVCQSKAAAVMFYHKWYFSANDAPALLLNDKC